MLGQYRSVSVVLLLEVVLVALLPACYWCLNNGLARTPPMGWLTWERFECNTDCQSDRDNCIGEWLLMQTADVMAAEGYLAAGYEYIAIDDCWLANDRDKTGRLQPDPSRFPHGMKALIDYVHAKGLKFGIYEDVGTHTCAGFPGCQDNYELDAQTFADWGVDMLKFDGCNTDVPHYNYGYPAMGHFLNKTGRPIMYSCEWPIYMRALGAQPNYTAVAETCNSFRAYGDILDSFESIRSIIGWYASNEGQFLDVVQPGIYTDADMLVVGDFGLSYDEQRIQVGMWAMFASQLMISADLRTMDRRSQKLLLNKRIIAINQDSAGIPGRHILKMYDGTFHVWTRPLSTPGSYAVAAVYLKMDGFPIQVSLQLSALNLTESRGYNVTELFDGFSIGHLVPSQNLTFYVNPSGINMLRADVYG